MNRVYVSHGYAGLPIAVCVYDAGRLGAVHMATIDGATAIGLGLDLIHVYVKSNAALIEWKSEGS